MDITPRLTYLTLSSPDTGLLKRYLWSEDAGGSGGSDLVFCSWRRTRPVALE